MRIRDGEESPAAAWRNGGRVLVVGLGRFGGGVGVVRWLVSAGADVCVTDVADRETLEASVAAISDLPVRCRFGGHDAKDLQGVELVVLNPAVDKRRSDLFDAVKRASIPWTTEINLFCERCPCPVIAVTGTYGKSTTCAMLAQALRACREQGKVGYDAVHLGGNFGGSLVTKLDRIGARDLVVMELSSAQLEDLPRIDWAPHVAVITNLTPHHLDRYDDLDEYVESKLHVLGARDTAEWVVVGDLHQVAETALRSRFRQAPDRLIRVSPPGSDLRLTIPGVHNLLNAACVQAVCRCLGLDAECVSESLRSFQGLEHRLERLRTLDGVTYYNDSKSTSPAASIRAVEALTCPIVAIVGGQEKGVPLVRFAEVLSHACSTVICVGESGPAFAEAIRDAARGVNPAVVREADGLDEAIGLARGAARPGSAVLFSPGAPSFDAHVNFAERGRCFVDIVSALV